MMQFQQEMTQDLWLKNFKGREHLEDLGANGRIILKSFYVVKV